MNDQIHYLLESNSAQDRKKAIRLMAQMGGQEVLRTLAGLYKYDPDPDVQRLALEAGKSIKRQETAEFAALMSEGPSTPAAKKTTSSTRVVPAVKHVVDEEPDYGINTVFVSPMRESQGADLLEKAETALNDEKPDTSLDLLIKAFKANPNYRLDNQAMKMGLSLTGMERSEFHAMLEDDILIARTVRSLRSSKEPKQKNKSKLFTVNRNKDEAGDAHWSAVFVDLGICFVALSAIMMLYMFILVQIYQGAATASLHGCPGCTNQEILRLKSLIQDTHDAFSITPFQGALLGLISAALFVFQLFVYYGVLHVALHYYLSPEGTFRGMLHHCVRFDLALYCIAVGIFGAVALLILRDVYDPHYYTLYAEGGTPLWKPLVNIGGIVVIIGSVWSYWRLLKYYNEGCFQVGCVMTIAYSIASTLLSGIAAGFLDDFVASLVKLVLGR